MTTELQELSREISNGENLKQLVDQFTKNRNLLLTQAEKFGLNRDYLVRQDEVVVGPFVSPAPLPTTFGGSVMNVRYSIATTNAFCALLEAEGFKTKPELVIPLAITEIPVKGSEAINALIVPKNSQITQRLPLIDATEKGTAYKEATISIKTLQSVIKTARDTFPIFMDRFPYLRRQTPNGRLGEKILSAVTSDIELAFRQIAQSPEKSPSLELLAEEDISINYLKFAAAFNQCILKRIYPDMDLPQDPIDSTLYNDFMRNCITNIATFTQTLEGLGVFKEDPDYVKIVDPTGKTRILQLDTIEDSDIVLKFRDDGSLIRYSDLIRQDTLIAPCKSISYLLCFGSFIPVIYGDDNWGNKVYEPYAKARQQLTTLGLSPVMYRIQPQIPEGYKEATTIFDFYGQLLNLL